LSKIFFLLCIVAETEQWLIGWRERKIETRASLIG
jgi:hypothetical protein